MRGQHDHHRPERVEQVEVEAVAGGRGHRTVEGEVRLHRLLGYGGHERGHRRPARRRPQSDRRGGQRGRLALHPDAEVDHGEDVVVGADAGGLDP